MITLATVQCSEDNIVGYSDDDKKVSKRLKPCPDAVLINRIVNTSFRQAATYTISSMYTDLSKGIGLFLKTDCRVD